MSYGQHQAKVNVKDRVGTRMLLPYTDLYLLSTSTYHVLTTHCSRR